MPHLDLFEKLSKAKIKFIKSLSFKKSRLQENAFVIEGAKNIAHLLASDYVIDMIVGTADFLGLHHPAIAQRTQDIFQADQDLLASLGNFQSNNTGLAVATTKPNIPVTVSEQEYSLVLDGIQDPGNLGTIIRIADWYGIKAIICSLHTVELYNPKVLHASMGSFTNVQLYYTNLAHYLSQVKIPIIGTFTIGENLHQAALPAGGLVVIGNETRGISQELMPYIHQRINIPNYGNAESLNAAVATAIICDNIRRITRACHQLKKND